jgi:hypothetical protein
VEVPITLKNNRCNGRSLRAGTWSCPPGILLEFFMLTLIRTLITLVVVAFAVIGACLLLILWHIRQHPFSAFYWINLLRHLPV